MSCYDDDGDDDLYPEGGQTPDTQLSAVPSPVSSPAAPAPSPSGAVTQSLELIAAGPAELVGEVLAPEPSALKLPLGVAVLGACAAAILWANSIDSKSRRK